MKNISGKTMIFYTFQQKKDFQYNMIPYQTQQQPILIKDVIQQLPLDLSTGRYHFRFKSEFNQGNQKIIGWIDINNLMAKVPHVAGSIYVKILKVKSNVHNKLFNLQKLAKVGLGSRPMKKQSSTSILSNSNNKTSINNNNIKPPTSPRVTQQQQIINKPVLNNNIIKQPSLLHSFPKQSIPKKQLDIFDQQIEQTTIIHPAKLISSVPVPTNNGQINTDFLQVKKPYVNNQTPEEKLQRMRKVLQQQQQARADQLIARDQLEEKIKKWGYSGAKTINNLTTLLSTLHQIWPQWQPVSLSQLLNPEGVAVICKKALIKTHPDKNRNKPFRQKYLSKRVFQLLNDAKKAA